MSSLSLSTVNLVRLYLKLQVTEWTCVPGGGHPKPFLLTRTRRGTPFSSKRGSTREIFSFLRVQSPFGLCALLRDDKGVLT